MVFSTKPEMRTTASSGSAAVASTGMAGSTQTVQKPERVKPGIGGRVVEQLLVLTESSRKING